jgi:APA family basic amino acid/polyamine antiporter
MQTNWEPKPGDIIFRPRRIKRFRLKRVLGIPALFSAGYGDIGSSIYYGLGIVALVALGATPIVLAVAGIIYVFNALTYAEGGAMIPEGGGSASYARHGFNNLVGFIAGWSLMLSYIATMAISAYTIPPYLAYFWPVLKEPATGTIVSMGIVSFLILINVLGVRESTGLNISFIVIGIVTQVALVFLGIILIMLPNPTVLSQHMFGTGNWPSIQNMIFGIALAALCFTGVETVSQLADETRQPQRRIPQAYILMVFIVLLLFAGISIVALSAMTPQELANQWGRDPIAGIANSISTVMSPAEMAGKITSEPAAVIVLTWLFNGVRSVLPVLVAVLAGSILFTATNAGLLGISRLTYNMSSHRQLPTTLSHVHHRLRTPYLAIVLFGLLALLVLVPGFFSPDFFTDLGALYVFGSLLTFALAHAAILALRIRQPDMHRPFKLALNIKIGRHKLPLTAILGLVSTLAIWVIILIIQPNSRWAGLAWMTLGLVIYYIYQRSKPSKDKPEPPDSAKDDLEIRRKAA